jgi:putative restriction endonuclease
MDGIAFRYHFPRQYRAVAETLVGGWIIYRELSDINAHETELA